MPGRELTSNPLPDSKTQEEKENEKMSLFNALNPGDRGLAAERFLPPPPLLLDTPEIGPRGVTAPPLYDKGMVSPLKIHQGTQFGQGATLSRAGQFPLRQYPIGGINQEAQSAGYYCASTPFSTSELLNWKNSNPSYRSSEKGRSHHLHFCHSPSKWGRCTGCPSHPANGR